MDLGALAMKGYSAFSKAPALLEPYHQIVNVISRTLEMQSVYSIALSEWPIIFSINQFKTI